jgi:fructose-bisphosphate aldolase class II
MALTNTHEMAISARAELVGIGAFNVVHVESAERFVAGAEAAGRPVILQISENAVKFHGALAPIARACLAIAESARVSVAVHLDHAEDLGLIYEALKLGMSSIMFDGSKLVYEENVRVTREIADRCHALGVSIEAELGEVGGKNGVHDPSARTEPQQAREFVERTEVDLLAVAVGSSHAMTQRVAALDNPLISAIAAVVPVPLVLHGSSGVSDESMVLAIEAGITKVNVSTHLNSLFTKEVRKYLDENPQVVDTRKYLKPGYDAVENEVFRLLKLYSRN